MQDNPIATTAARAVASPAVAGRPIPEALDLTHRAIDHAIERLGGLEAQLDDLLGDLRPILTHGTAAEPEGAPNVAVQHPEQTSTIAGAFVEVSGRIDGIADRIEQAADAILRIRTHVEL